MAGKRSVKLRSADDVVRLLGRIINGILRGEIENEKGGKIGYLANILLRALSQNELEDRVEALEKKLDQRSGK